MRNVVIPVDIQPLEEGGYLAVCEAIQGCHAEGDTVEEAVENLKDVARTLLELRKEDGLPPPAGLETYELDAPIHADVVALVE